MVKTILEQATGLSAYPFLSMASGECIVYTIEPQSDDGIKKQDRITVRVIADNIPKSETYSIAVRQAMLTVGDAPKGDYFECHLNGGGSLRDPDTHKVHTILYFYATKRSEVTT